MKKIIVLFLIFAIISVTQVIKAESPEEKGMAIFVEADKRETGFGDSESELTMILKNRHGDESVRKIRGKTLEVKDDGDKSLSIFDNPKDVKGTAMLTHTHKKGNDDQWLFLPALKRVKRISSSNKSGSFMGSEFAYEDMGSQEIEKHNYKYIRDEEYEGKKCFVIERYPTDKKSGYTRQVVWTDQQEYIIYKIDYFDRKKSLLKTLTATNYKKYKDKFWRPGEMNMVNHQNGKSTKLIFENYKFQTGLKDSDFNKNSLKRAK